MSTFHTGYIIAETSHAILLAKEPLVHCDDPIWFPKSKIITTVGEWKEGCPNKEEVTIKIPNWLAEAKGL